MSTLAINTSASTTLPAVSFHHGHKKGLRMDSNSAADTLDRAFNNLLQGLSANGAPASAAGSAASTLPANAARQNFLNSLLQNLQANAAQSPKTTGFTVNATV
jgi:hypothetical protein